MKKRILLVTIFCLSLSQFSSAQAEDVYRQDLLNPNAISAMTELSLRYKARNTINPIFLNFYPADNRGETFQTRMALETKRQKNPHLLIYDMINENPIDWRQSPSNIQIPDSEYLLAMDTANLDKSNAPILLIFTSNTHTMNSFLDLGMIDYLANLGIVPVVMEYPGYGGSLGKPSRPNWRGAAVGAVHFLSRTLKRKIFLLGHSIGGGVATDVLLASSSEIAGFMTFATFYSILEMSKDQANVGGPAISKFINPILTKLGLPDALYDNSQGIPLLVRNLIPSLFMHGANDGSVPYRHFSLLNAVITKEKIHQPNAPIFAQTFQSGHEDIFISELDSFSNIWETILKFMQMVAQRDSNKAVQN